MCSQILLTNVGYLILLIFALRSQMQKERDETKEAVADIAKSLQVFKNIIRCFKTPNIQQESNPN